MKKREVKWWHQGIAFGIFMYLFTTLLLPFIIGSSISGKGFLIALPVWIAGGLCYGRLVQPKTKHSNSN